MSTKEKDRKLVVIDDSPTKKPDSKKMKTEDAKPKVVNVYICRY